MKVTVKLFATFRIGRFTLEERDYAPGTTVAQVADELALDRADLGIMLVNSRHVKTDYVLQDGDVLALFPLLGGG
jgi:molybdopterin converting factor small subunit